MIYDAEIRKYYYETEIGAVSWPLCPPADMSWTEHKSSFVDILILGSGKLPYRQPWQPQEPYRIFSSPEVSNVIENQTHFQAVDSPPDERFIGVLNGIWRIWRLGVGVLQPKHFVIVRGEDSVPGMVTGSFDLL